MPVPLPVRGGKANITRPLPGKIMQKLHDLSCSIPGFRSKLPNLLLFIQVPRFGINFAE
jgi:hypothetical protein